MTQGNGVRHAVEASAVHNILVNMVTTAAGQLVQKGLEKEDWIVERVQNVLEDNDQLLPGLRDYADLPWVNDLEARGVEFLIRFGIRKAYSFAEAMRLLPAKTPTAPTPEPTDADKKVADALGVDTSQLTKFGYEAKQGDGQPSPPTPPAPDQTGASSEQVGADDNTDDNDDPDYAAIAAEYKDQNSNWYKFPPEPESDSKDTVNKNGLEAAIEYLKERDDLVYDSPESEGNPQGDAN